MSTPLPAIEEVKEAFAFLDDWEDRYRYIMDLGERLDPLAQADRIDANLVHGCQSTVWVVMHVGDGGVAICADSDSHLVKGLAALVVVALHGLGLAQIAEYDFDGFFSSLRLHEHLSPTRSNGLHGMVRQVQSRARAMQSA